jgi:hypothetical protein
MWWARAWASVSPIRSPHANCDRACRIRTEAMCLWASAEEDHPELSNEPRMEVKNDQARLCPARFRSATIPVAASTIESRIRIADDTPGVG